MSSQGNWPYVINLANSIIGVSILTTPLCFKECGILLGTILLVVCGFLTRASCYILLKAAFLSRRRSYEFLALHLFGPTAKLLVEISTIGFLVGICIAFFVVIGDLGPHFISQLLGIESSEILRICLLVAVAVFVEFPLSMLRNIKSLGTLSAICVCFYVIFVFKIFLEAIPVFLMENWWLEVNWWKTGGVFRALPIFAMSFSCQTQLFVIYDGLPEPSPKKMNSVIAGAVNICCIVYFSVAFFGYVAFYEKDITGDILVSFEPTVLANIMKICFLMTIIISYPLSVFPCRESLHSLLFKQNIPHDLPGAIPASRFKMITLSIISTTLIVAILVPNVETVLGLTGSTMGCAICFILPAVLFIGTQSKPNAERLMAQIVLSLGVFVLVASTYATLNSAHEPHVDKSVVANVREDFDQNNNVIPKIVPTLKLEYSTESQRKLTRQPIKLKEVIDQPEVPEIPLSNLSLKAPFKISRHGIEKQEDVKQMNEEHHMKLNEDQQENVGQIQEKHNKLIEKLEEQHREQLKLIEEQKQLLHELKQHKQEAHQEIKNVEENLNNPKEAAINNAEKSNKNQPEVIFQPVKSPLSKSEDKLPPKGLPKPVTAALESVKNEQHILDQVHNKDENSLKEVQQLGTRNPQEVNKQVLPDHNRVIKKQQEDLVAPLKEKNQEAKIFRQKFEDQQIENPQDKSDNEQFNNNDLQINKNKRQEPLDSANQIIKEPLINQDDKSVKQRDTRDTENKKEILSSKQRNIPSTKISSATNLSKNFQKLHKSVI